MSVTSWSYSKYSTYAKCPRQYKLKYIDKLPEPQSPAMERGNVIHKMAEDFLNSGAALTPELLKFKAVLEWLKSKGAHGERQITINDKWEETGWFAKDAWCRMKLDADVFGDDGVSIDLVDWKTGKMYDENKLQLEFYAAVIFALIAHIETVRVHLCYLDNGKELTETYTRAKHGQLLKAQWVGRAMAMLKDDEFAPRPNDKCKWCTWNKQSGKGLCRYG